MYIFRRIDLGFFLIFWLYCLTRSIVTWVIFLCGGHILRFIIKNPYLNINKEFINNYNFYFNKIIESSNTLFLKPKGLRIKIFYILLIESLLLYLLYIYSEYKAGTFDYYGDEYDFDKIERYSNFVIQHEEHVLNIVEEDTIEYYVNNEIVISTTDYSYIRLKTISPIRKKTIPIITAHKRI